VLSQGTLRRPFVRQAAGLQAVEPGPFFHEFVLRCPAPVQEINSHLLEHGILAVTTWVRITRR